MGLMETYPELKTGVTPLLKIARNAMRIRNDIACAAIGEFVGTGMVTLFAVGGGIHSSMHDSRHVSILGGIYAVNAAIIIVGGLSGGHVNPAVTLGLCITGFCSWFKFPVLFLAQLLGGYLGTGLAMGLYTWDKGITAVELAPIPSGPDPNITICDAKHKDNCTEAAKIYNITVANGIIDQVVGTSILVMLVIACCDQRNMKIPSSLVGFFVALTIGAWAMCFGVNAGAVLNPARGLGARLFGLTIPDNRYKVETLLVIKGMHWWTVGFFGPLLGAIVGAVVYILFVGAHLIDPEEEEADVKSNTQSGNVSQLNLPPPPDDQGSQDDLVDAQKQQPE